MERVLSDAAKSHLGDLEIGVATAASASGVLGALRADGLCKVYCSLLLLAPLEFDHQLQWTPRSCRREPEPLYICWVT